MNRTEEIYPGVKIPAYVENFFKPSIAEKYGFYAGEVEKNAFHPNGEPVEVVPSPFYAANILGIPVSYEYATIEPEFSKAAAIPVWKYMQSVYGVHSPFADGASLADAMVVQRNGYTYQFPAFELDGNRVKPPVLVVADVPQNDEDWMENRIPYSLLVSCRLYCALIREFSGISVSGIHVVRITGNLTVDMSFRWIPSDIADENRILAACDRVLSQRAADGAPLIPAIITAEERNWRQIIQEREDSAMRIQDHDLHDKIKEYMGIRSQRKAVEEQIKMLKASEDAILLQLASHMLDAEAGELQAADGKHIYRITHSKSTSREKITPSLIRAYAPEYISCIKMKEEVLGKVDVDVV